MMIKMRELSLEAAEQDAQTVHEAIEALDTVLKIAEGRVCSGCDTTIEFIKSHRSGYRTLLKETIPTLREYAMMLDRSALIKQGGKGNDV